MRKKKKKAEQGGMGAGIYAPFHYVFWPLVKVRTTIRGLSGAITHSSLITAY